MKTLLAVIVSLWSYSFAFAAEKEESKTKSGYYIVVEDYTDQSSSTYLVESKDSADVIFDHFFESELVLGKVNYPISIDNGKQNFFIARIELFESKNGKMKFKHLKYPKISKRRKQQDPAEF